MDCGPLQKPLFLLLLALNAVAGPGNSVQAFGLNILLAFHTVPVRAVLRPAEGILDQQKNTAVVVTLMEKEFLGVRICCPVCRVVSDLIVDLATVLVRTRDHPANFFLLGQQLFSVAIYPAFIHKLLV